MASGFGIENLPRLAYGRGSYLYDTQGRCYIDGSGGPAVFCLGHGNDEVNEAITEQLDRFAHAYRYTFTSEAAEELTEIINRSTGGHFRNVVYVSSGSEAVESCLKIALQYFSAIGQQSKRGFIARERSWHGNTLGALSISGFLERRRAFEGALINAGFVSAANDYRPAGGVDADALVDYLADELEEEIQRAGPDNVAAFVFEPVVGAAGGVVPAPDGYARRIREVCDRYDVLVIADEVMCGSGRCGTWRALEHDGIVPDIMAVAKGLAAGYLPLGAALYSDSIAEMIMRHHGAVQTGHTFTAHTAACAAGVAVQRIIEREGLIARVAERGRNFRRQVRDRLANIPIVGDVRGRGYFVGVEFVEDRVSRQPFDPVRRLHFSIGTRAFELGLVCYPCSGNVDGVAGDTVILAPPYNASDTELDEIVDKFGHAVEATIST